LQESEAAVVHGENSGRPERASISASAHGRSSPVELALQVLKRVLRFVDG
jgi:hypothetical protein